MEDDIGIDSEDVLVSRSVQMDNSTQNERGETFETNVNTVRTLPPFDWIHARRRTRGIDESRWRKTVLVPRLIREGKGREGKRQRFSRVEKRRGVEEREREREGRGEARLSGFRSANSFHLMRGEEALDQS